MSGLTHNRPQVARSGKDGAAMPQKAIFWIFLIFLLLAFPVTVSAQTGDGMIIIAGIVYGLHQFADLSLDFSVAPTTNTPGNEKVRPLGVIFGVTVNVRKNIGIDGELSGQSGKPVEAAKPFCLFEYLIGPRFSVHGSRATAFLHTLVGGAHHWQDSPVDPHISDEGGGFAMAYGGGLDINVSRMVAIRAFQVDWIPIRENGFWKTDLVRFGFGLVLRARQQ
jgi:hypothetical protein